MTREKDQMIKLVRLESCIKTANSTPLSVTQKVTYFKGLTSEINEKDILKAFMLYVFSNPTKKTFLQKLGVKKWN